MSPIGTGTELPMCCNVDCGQLATHSAKWPGAAKPGRQFFCTHHALMLVQVSNTLGIDARIHHIEGAKEIDRERVEVIDTCARAARLIHELILDGAINMLDNLRRATKEKRELDA